MRCKCKMIFTNSKRKKREAQKTGHSFYPEYNIWAGLKTRCNINSKSKCFNKYYTGKVKIDSNWAISFSNFYRDMGPRPGPRYSIDRKDNSGGYCKHNCRWATKYEQIMNRKMGNNIRSVSLGVRKNKSGNFSVRIVVLGVMLTIGTFGTKKRAIDEYNRFSKYFAGSDGDLL